MTSIATAEDFLAYRAQGDERRKAAMQSRLDSGRNRIERCSCSDVLCLGWAWLYNDLEDET